MWGRLLDLDPSPHKYRTWYKSLHEHLAGENTERPDEWHSKCWDDYPVWEMKPDQDAGTWGRSSPSVLSLNCHNASCPPHKLGFQPSQDSYSPLLSSPLLPHGISPKPGLDHYLSLPSSHRAADPALGHGDDRNSSQCLPGWVTICDSLPVAIPIPLHR